MGELRKSQMVKMQQNDQNGNFNPNALVQLDELKELGIDFDEESDSDKEREEDHDDEPAPEIRPGMMQKLESIQEKIDHISRSVSEEASPASKSPKQRGSIIKEMNKDKVNIISAANDRRESRDLRRESKMQRRESRNDHRESRVHRRKSRMPSAVGMAESNFVGPTRRSSLTMRKSIYQIAEGHSQKKKGKAKGRSRMSIARASMFRRCEPAMALDGQMGGAQA